MPKTTPKDFFIHLGVIITFYTSVVSLFNLCFDIINHYLPDALSSYDISSYSIRLSISMLLILLPLTYLLEWLIRKDIVKDPTKNDIWVRKWRIFLTLFLTGATIAIDLIVLINTYLGGEISERFILKVVTVLVLSAIIFVLFLLERGAQEKTFWTRRGLRILIGVIALIAIIIGFVSVGSPYTQRQIRFDSQRVSDLSMLDMQITQYWQRNSVLPATLEKALGTYTTVPTDPDTKTPYVYNVKGNMEFELCATFSLSSDAEKDSQTVPEYYVIDSTKSWDHSAGYACFDRTIDPDIYPPMNTTKAPLTAPIPNSPAPAPTE